MTHPWSSRCLAWLGVLLLAGCATTTASPPWTYRAGLRRPENAPPMGTAPLGVARFVDRRPWADPGRPASAGAISPPGRKAFTLREADQPAVPLAPVVQRLLVQELRGAGSEARALPETLPRADRTALRAAGQLAGCDYVLAGEILSFEIAVEGGTTATRTRRTVALGLTLLRVRDGEVAWEARLEDQSEEESAFGILDATNVDKLMNEVFKTVVRAAVEQLAPRLSATGRPGAIVAGLGGSRRR